MEKIKSKSNFGKDAGNIIVTLPKIKFLAPRAKNIISMYKKSLKLHGDTNDYMIKYKDIWRAFMLP